MKLQNTTIFIVFMLLVLTAGCSQDSVKPDTEPPGQVQAALDPAGGGFSLVVATATTPTDFVEGPFHLRGENVHYDYDGGNLVFDLIIRNDSVRSYRDPVSITFHRFIPDDVILVSPDDGPTLYFEFANDDLWWTPGEESFPLQVRLVVAPGTAVGFQAEIGVGGGDASGAIGGVTWLDDNSNGVQDPGEGVLPGVQLRLDDGTDHVNLVLATSGADGRYRFGDLPAGFYEVSVYSSPWAVATTPTSMHVVLVGLDGGVSRFDRADFGFIQTPVLPGLALQVKEESAGTVVVGVPGVTEITRTMSVGQVMEYSWNILSGWPDGPLVVGFRHGWNVADPNDENDPGWAVPAGLEPENLAAEPFTLPPGLTRLTVQCWDQAGNLTRVNITHAVAPDTNNR